MPGTGLTRTLGQAQSIDFVNRFGNKLKSLQELLGLQRVIKVPAGGLLHTYTSEVTLDGTEVPPGAVIPLSEVKRIKGDPIEFTWDKKRKAVPAEDIQAYGYDVAIAETDRAFLGELQKGIRDAFIDQLAKGTGTSTGSGLQEVMAQNFAAVVTAFEEDDAEVVSFVNPFDVADYLGNAQVTTQTAFGMNYLEGFLNNKVAFMHPSVPKGTVYSTAIGNLVIGHADMRGGALGKAFGFTTDSSGIIGVLHDVNPSRLTAETVAASAVAIFAERLDGVVKGSIAPEV